jgi:hypothetical protein
MTPKHPVYPFAALVGQERLKLALVLNAINPLLGGVLIRGEKGTAKSTAARGLAELLPPIAMVMGCPFHCHPELPELMCDACGKTPLPHALFLARELLRREKARHPRDAFLLVLITDGRANLSLGKGRKPMEEVKELAAQIGTLGINALVLDTERFAPCLDLGCLPELSRLLGGQYRSLQSLRAPEVVACITAAQGDAAAL